MTNVAWRTFAGGGTMGRMDPAQLLAACGLVVGTVDYALMVRRRAAMRRRWREAAAAQDAGLQGLVRVLLIDR